MWDDINKRAYVDRVVVSAVERRGMSCWTRAFRTEPLGNAATVIATFMSSAGSIYLYLFCETTQENVNYGRLIEAHLATALAQFLI